MGVLYNISWNIQDADYMAGMRYMSTGNTGVDKMKKGDIVELGQVIIVLREDGRQLWEEESASRDNKGDAGDGHGGAGNKGGSGGDGDAGRDNGRDTWGQ